MAQAKRKFRLPHPEPRDALKYARFAGVSPPYDTGEITSLLAVNILFEMLCVF